MPDMLRQGLTEAHAAKFLTAARGPANKAIGEHHHRIPQPFRYARQGLKNPTAPKAQPTRKLAGRRHQVSRVCGRVSYRMSIILLGVIPDVHHPSSNLKPAPIIVTSLVSRQANYGRCVSGALCHTVLHA